MSCTCYNVNRQFSSCKQQTAVEKRERVTYTHAHWHVESRKLQKVKINISPKLLDAYHKISLDWSNKSFGLSQGQSSKTGPWSHWRGGGFASTAWCLPPVFLRSHTPLLDQVQERSLKSSCGHELRFCFSTDYLGSPKPFMLNRIFSEVSGITSCSVFAKQTNILVNMFFGT